MTTSNLAQLEQFRKELEYTKGVKDSLVKLGKNKDFQKVMKHITETKLMQVHKDLGKFTTEVQEKSATHTIKGIAVFRALLAEIIESGEYAEHYLALNDKEIALSLGLDEGDSDE